MKKILIINGHPTKNSFCSVLSETYAAAATTSGNDLFLLNLFDLNFDLNLSFGYSKREKPGTDILFAQEKIKWADHIVIIHPVWWGSVPALLKGFFDSAFLPDFAFKYRKDSVFWDKLLSGRTARIIYTADTPIWIYKYIYLAPSVTQIKKRTLQFCGIDRVGVTAIGPIRKSKNAFREKWIEKIGRLGEKAA